MSCACRCSTAEPRTREDRAAEDARRVLHHPACERAHVGAPRDESLVERLPVRRDAPGERASAPVLAGEPGGEEGGAPVAVRRSRSAGARPLARSPARPSIRRRPRRDATDGARPRAACIPSAPTSGAERNATASVPPREVWFTSAVCSASSPGPAREQVHHAAERRCAVQRRRRPLDHLDAAEVQRRDLEQPEPARLAAVEREPVGEQQRVAAGEPLDAHVRAAERRAGRLHAEARRSR